MKIFETLGFYKMDKRDDKDARRIYLMMHPQRMRGESTFDTFIMVKEKLSESGRNVERYSAVEAMTWSDVNGFRIIARTVGMRGTKAYYTRRFEKASAGREVFAGLKEALLKNGFVEKWSIDMCES